MATLKRKLYRAAFDVFVPSTIPAGSVRGLSGALIPTFHSSRFRSIPSYSDNSRIFVTGPAAVRKLENSLSRILCDSHLSVPSVPTRLNSTDSFSSDTEICTNLHSNFHLCGSHGLSEMQFSQSPLKKCSSPSFPTTCVRKISVSSFSTHQHKYNTNTNTFTNTNANTFTNTKANTKTNLRMLLLATGSGQKSSICTSTRLFKEGPASSSESSSNSENFGKQQKEIEQRTVTETESVKLGDRQKEEDVPSQFQSNSGVPLKDHRIIEIVQLGRSATDLGSYFFNLWSSVKMAGYVHFHKAVLEESFDVDDFLEGARHAFTVVQELFGNGDFETLSTMASPRVVGGFKDAYGVFVEKHKNQGWRVEFTVNKVDSASLVDFEFAFEEDGKGYGLQNLVPQIDNYHDDMFLVLAVQLYAEVSMRSYDNDGLLHINTITKGLRIMKLGRQVPKITSWGAPVKEFKSPWFFVDLR